MYPMYVYECVHYMYVKSENTDTLMCISEGVFIHRLVFHSLICKLSMHIRHVFSTD